MYKIYIRGMYKYEDFYTLSGIKYLRGDRSFRFSNFTFLASSQPEFFADRQPRKERREEEYEDVYEDESE